MLGHLECFVCSAENGSFSAAGRKLGISSAAVGKNVTKLETIVGVRLFQRNTRKLILTEEGERFLQEVSGGLLSIQCALKGISSSGGVAAGHAGRSAWGTAFRPAFLSCRCCPTFWRVTRQLSQTGISTNRKVDLIG
jgi:DNA-binding transcriptional LysR family regulator